MTPVPPKGVQVVRSDGTVVPVELVYEGFWNHTHVWATNVAMSVEDHLQVEMLPPYTSIRVGLP